MEIDDLREALENIPVQERRAMVLHDILGYKYKEIARILGVKTNSVGVYIHRARVSLFAEKSSTEDYCYCYYAA